MMRRECAVPGCSARLYPENDSGVCRKHIHAAGICRCPRCTGREHPYRVRTRGYVRHAVPEPQAQELERVPGRLYEFPAADAPLGDWLLPVSGRMRGRGSDQGLAVFDDG